MIEFYQFQVRNLELRHCETDCIRVITHYHYLEWPDFGVPSSTSPFLKLVNKVHGKNPSTPDSPNIVHCSAGIGRSGTYILADACLEKMRQNRRPMSRNQIIESLIQMRAMRKGLIQTAEQLRFCLQAIEDAMEDMDFIDLNHCDSSSSSSTLSTTNNRKRSTDDTQAEIIDNHEQIADKNEAADASTTPKRPKANC